MKKWIVVTIASLYFVIFLYCLVYLFYFLVGNRVITETVRSFEIHINQRALMVAKRTPAKGNLLDFVLDYHM